MTKNTNTTFTTALSISVLIASTVMIILFAQLASAQSLATNSTSGGGAPTIDPISIMATSSSDSASIFWNTDQVATSQVAYGTSTSYVATTTGDTFALNHLLVIGDLLPDTTYHYQVSSSNGVGIGAPSADQTFTTAATSTSGNVPPAILSITVIPTYSIATIIWTTTEPASSLVLYGTTPQYTASSTGYDTLAPTLSTTHSVSISNLMAGTTYHFAILSTTIASSTAASSDQVFTTPSIPAQ